MFRIQVKHSLRLFIQKQQKEIQGYFPTARLEAIKEYIDVDTNDEVQVEASKQKLDQDEGGLGQVNIEIRYIQENEGKNISLQGWGFGPWKEPFIETPKYPKHWGKFLLLPRKNGIT